MMKPFLGYIHDTDRFVAAYGDLEMKDRAAKG